MPTEKPILKMIVPCYNEEDGLALFCKELKKVLLDLIKERLIRDQSFILLVNDGSNDHTWQIINDLANDIMVTGISLAHNRGHQTALLAGLYEDKRAYDICISVDADGQDDLSVIKDMILDWYNQKKIVYGVRKKRDTDSLLKKTTANLFYQVMAHLEPQSIQNHADFRLLDKSIVDELKKYPEHNLYLRGLFQNMISSNQTSIVYYDRKKREIGQSKYSVKKMMNLATNGIISMSNEPLHFIFRFTVLFIFLTILCIMYNIFCIFVHRPSTLAILITVMMVCTGSLLLALSIIAQYIAGISIESKHQPRYWINDRTE